MMTTLIPCKKLKKIKKTAHKKPMPVYARILDIQSELGELAKEYLKHSRYGTVDFDLQNKLWFFLIKCR